MSEVNALRSKIENSIKDIFKKFDVPKIDFSENGIDALIHYSHNENNDCIEAVTLRGETLVFEILAYIGGCFVEQYEVGAGEISIENLEYLLKEFKNLKEIVE